MKFREFTVASRKVMIDLNSIVAFTEMIGTGTRIHLKGASGPIDINESYLFVSLILSEALGLIAPREQRPRGVAR